MNRSIGLFAAIPLLALAAPSSADTALSAPAGHGQQALAARVEGTTILARVCASGACSPDGGAALPVPEDARKGLARAKGSRVELADGKSLLRFDVPGEGEGATWVMLLAAPISGRGTEPLVVWSGWTGLARGELGEERSGAVLEEPLKKGGKRVLVGERRGDVTLCGRPTIVAAKELDPATMELTRGASVQNLTDAERAAATKISAARVAGKADATAGAIRLLRATAASSAVDKKFGTLTDGDADTVWSENKAGDGHGEFVSIGSASEVGITSFELSVKPSSDVPEGAAPKTLYLATADKLFEIAMPEDAWRQPAGTRYSVKLAEPLHAGCVAVVLGDAYAPAGARNARVTLAEIEARTPFDGLGAEALVGALAGGGDRSKGAAAMLARAGKAGVTATIAGYPKLDAAGRQLAASVIDAAPCGDQVPFWAERVVAAAAAAPPAASPQDKQRSPGGGVDSGDPELSHARDRLRRCGRLAAPALAKIVADAAPPDGKPASAAADRARLIAADELALVAPAEAVPVILDALGKAGEAARRELRASLSRAAKSARAWPAIKDELDKLGARPEEAAIDLLRAVGPSLGKVEGSGDAFAKLAGPGASFRSRYLLQAPGAELARAGDTRAEAWIREALRKDADPHVRGRAAEVAARVPGLAPDLVAAIDDPEVRVREAAINALAEAGGAGVATPPGLAAALGKRLGADDWTFVRAGAAKALGALPADATVDAGLAAALTDISPDVRGRVLDALGAHRATAFSAAIRARQDDATEDLEVRARAILALASMCDGKSVDAWTKLAQGAKAPMDERDRRLGGAAIGALGVLHPADLPKRLAPLLEKDAPPGVREMARAAIDAKSNCH